MPYHPGRPGCVAPSEELSTKVRALILRLGPTIAAGELGVGRETALTIGCGAPVSRGSIALAEGGIDRLTRSDQQASVTLGGA